MISQADIIRSLVNKTCTDESIMSTALSPDCTLPKLLQKFTEAERFDLAIDVYMKLSMDVVPLWKTWALRCLKNRDFQGAREKFKHCFQRFRSSAGRLGVATNSLLEDILSELTRMEETKLALNEEIELIIKRARITDTGGSSHPEHGKITETKPNIFNECMHYLKEYGNIHSQIKFYVENELWDKAIATLFEARSDSRYNTEGFFITNIVLPSESSGHLDEVMSELIKLEPEIKATSMYFRALYNNYAKRYNTLYYVQNKIGDHVKAAENQVRNFFLKKPSLNYKELNQRLQSLICASDEYNKHLEKLRDKEQNARDHSEEETGKEFISKLTREETELRLKIIDTQIEITCNFAINEVTGCINGIDVIYGSASDKSARGEAQNGCHDENDIGEDSPVTLFDHCQRRKTFLAALILIYFDLDCCNYISDSGFRLASQIITECELDKLSVFKTAMNIIIEDESSNLIENANLLLKRLREDYKACTQRAKLKSPASTTTGTAPRGNVNISSNSSLSRNNRVSNNVISRPKESEKSVVVRVKGTSSSGASQTTQNRTKKKVYNFEPPDRSIAPGSDEATRLLCDEVIRETIKSCREEDYKMELVKLLSPEAKIVLYIELGKLSVAQRLSFDMKRPEYVKMVLREAEKLNQDHVKDVCQHWLAKH